jgi:hypothetical protein
MPMPTMTDKQAKVYSDLLYKLHRKENFCAAHMVIFDRLLKRQVRIDKRAIREGYSFRLRSVLINRAEQRFKNEIYDLTRKY